MLAFEASILTFLMVLISTATLCIGQNSSNKSVQVLERFSIVNKSPSKDELPIESSENFYRVLDSVLSYTDFDYLVVAIGRFGFQSKNHEIAMEYVHRRFFDFYQYDVEDFAKESNDLPDGMTWIILIDDHELLTARMKEIENFWRSENRYLIFCLKDSEGSDDWKNSLFRYVWNERSVSRILVSSLKEKFRYVYRYLPFEKTGNEYGRVQKLDLEREICDDRRSFDELPCPWNRSERGTDERLIFEDFINLNDYPIDVTVFPSLMMKISKIGNNKIVYEKLDAKVMKLLEERLSAVFNILVLPTSKTDRFEAAIQTFNSKPKAEVIFTSYLTKFYEGRYQFTAATLEDKLCVVAHSSKRVPKYFFPFLPFTTDLWLLLIAYNFAIALLWLLIQRLDALFRDNKSLGRVEPIIELSANMKSESDPRRFRYLGFDACESSGLSKRSKMTVLERLDRRRIIKKPPELPKGLLQICDLLILAGSPLRGGKTIVERVFLFGTLFFGLIVIGLYESYLVSSLSKILYYPQIQTLQQVAETNCSIVTKYVNLMHSIPTDGSPTLEKIRRKVEFLEGDTKTYDMVAYREKMSLALHSSFKLENLTAYYDPETNRLMLHMVEECPATYSVAYLARYDSPYVERIDRLILRMQQAGLIIMWYRQMLETGKIVASRLELKEDKKHSSLTLGHISMTLAGLGIGLLISTLVFFGEIYFAVKFKKPVSRLMLN
ncbi:uncharacterized protein [Venturia canescens]|uniref:uncharacterized protein n=1 Tax=Venturia canescens TaxID=32260 RepID=UPI001C9C5459|nr:uncharacterized protein LOC122412386 [Venturia canescens]